MANARGVTKRTFMYPLHIRKGKLGCQSSEYQALKWLEEQGFCRLQEVPFAQGGRRVTVVIENAEKHEAFTRAEAGAYQCFCQSGKDNAPGMGSSLRGSCLLRFFDPRNPSVGYHGFK